jgi:hypothetical protein
MTPLPQSGEKNMHTYVTVHMSSEGTKASEILNIFQGLGFEASLGNHDFVFKWKDKHVTPEKVIGFVDKVQEKLRGTQVLMHFTTVR